jgi:NAD-dependent deacetylase
MQNRTVIIFSGAGLSADSGIPTFRGKDGLWENHRVEDIAEHSAWWKNKEMVVKFYAERYEKYKECKPHAGHFAIAKLQEKFDVINITQNIDSLLEQAGCNQVNHLHGRMHWAKCEKHKDITNLDGDINFTCTFKKELTEPIKLGDTCECGKQLRPDIVMFNEAVDINFKQIENYVKEVKYKDGVFICVGTSMQVYPAAYLIPYFTQVKNKYIVDINPQQISNYTIIQGNAAETLPKLVEELLQ